MSEPSAYAPGGPGRKSPAVVVFDYGNTLVRVSKDKAAAHDACRIVLCEDGYEVAADELVSAMECGWQEYKTWRAKTMRELSLESVWHLWVFPLSDRLRRVRPSTAKRMLDAWYRFDHGIPPGPEVKRLLEELRCRGYKLAVVSNSTVYRARRECEEFGLYDSFDLIVTSCEFGLRKPSPEIFWFCLGRLGVAPGQAAVVGNSPERDMCGAARAGIPSRFLLWNEGGAAPNVAKPDGSEATHVIADLTDLLDYLA